ncbi:LytR/AlgR family response regulator transcription factor [Jiulongibacter sp. NS-SX5]|uniref:LytR/AlgR family response regulator transcription factor n=1 Tax=Jiulongibacter sp. NS-SX5 TaxID=3463854 RepID=UPI00405A1027
MKQALKIRIGGHYYAQPQHLLRLKADVNYTHIYFKDGTYKYVATTLGILEGRLHEYGFFRTNRSTIVNLSEIKSYRKKGTCMVASLANDTEVMISKRRVKDFLECHDKNG